MTTATGTTERLSPSERVLLHRRGVLYLPAAPDAVTAPGEQEIALLEADLLERGYLLSAPVRDALAAMAPESLGATGRTLLAEIHTALGAHRKHVPLFRGFPASVPVDTMRFFVDRVFALLLQTPLQPCALCGAADAVRPVSPCAHLVCGSCFDGSDFSACPICHRRIDPDHPFLRPAPARAPRADQWTFPQRMRVLHLGADLAGDRTSELTALLARTSAPPPADLDDLDALLSAGSHDDLSWLPERVPGREIKAHLLAWLLSSPRGVAAVAGLVDTATDVLRVLVLRSGGDAGLVSVPRFGAVPRPLRRTLLGLLDELGAARLAEDMRRHARLWKRAAEKLHPFEYAGRFPSAALAFAVLRGTSIEPGWPDAGVRAAAGETITVRNGRPYHRSWTGQVETALAAGDVPAALSLLRARPGELIRRLDHLLRLSLKIDDAGPQVREVLEAVAPAARRVSPAVLMSALGELRHRDHPPCQRVFFPKGGTAKPHVVLDERPPLPLAVVEPVTAALTAEALRRASLLPPADRAVLDTELDGLIAPFTERTASRALVTLPRGSALPLPDVRHLRFFVHWTETSPGPRVDLDLSLALYDEAWRHVGTCDYTSLRYGGSAAVHSGDLTSAPPPDGSSEFVDLDVEALTTAGVRHVVAVVFSYNGVAFEDLGEAFAGFMALTGSPESGEIFDPRSVEQRFDLTGKAYASVPVVIDLNLRQLRWLDVTAAVTGYGSAVHNRSEMLALLAEAMTNLYASGSRVSLGELATWHASARARTVLLRSGDGSLARFDRGEDEPLSEFAARISSWGLTDRPAPPAAPADAGTASLQFVMRGDLPAPEGASVYALHPAMLDPARVDLLTASDLAAQLDPVRD